MGLSIEESYQILQLPRGSSPEEIRASYKRLALKWHPDKHNNSSESTTKFQEISAAYKRLTTTEADDFELTPSEMYDLFTHIFFRRSASFFYRPATQPRCYDAKDYFDDDDYYYDDDDDDDDDEFDDEVLHGIASRLRSKYERKTEKPSATGSQNSGNSSHKLTEEEANKNAAELIEEEERDRKKAEKRRAKKKRNKEKKKQKEKDKGKEKTKKDGKENLPDKSDTQSETGKSKDKESKSTSLPTQSSKTVNSSSTQSTGLKEQREKTNKKQQSSGKLKTRNEDDDVSSEESPDWDTSSAFFARAAARNPANNTPANSQASSQATTTSNMDNTQESQNNKTSTEKQSRGEEMDPVVLRSRQIAVNGNDMANSGNYQAAVDLFSQAISLDDRDFRFFGNRSYCFDRMGQFEKALQDADMAISLAPDWPKGYFRRGRALAGLKLFLDAESSFAQVLKLDKHCEDALFELARVRIQQLEEMGFPASQSEAAIQSFGTVQAALEALLAGKVKCPTTDEVYLSEGEEEARAATSQSNSGCRSVWVGNVNSEEVSERQLLQLFTRCGRVENVRILPKRYCAFVNYESPESAARAIQRLQGYEMGGQNLVMRFPNNSGPSTTVAPPSSASSGGQPKRRSSPIEGNADKLSGPVNGGECYFWRTTGCAFGDKCHNAHIPAHKGIDLRKVEAKYGGRLRVN